MKAMPTAMPDGRYSATRFEATPRSSDRPAPTSSPTATAAVEFVGSASAPTDSTSAIARHAWAAGAGNSSPPIS